MSKAFLTTLPDFVEIQRSSFCWFLVHGLRDELNNFSLISDFTKTIDLHIFANDFKIRQPIYSIFESKQRDGTYCVQVYVPMTLTVFNKTHKRVNVLIGEIPLMTNRGTFVINGCERVVVNQILRSPGIYFKREQSSRANTYYTATLVPNRGSWLKFELNEKKQIHLFVDKSEKIQLLDFLNVIGFTLTDLKNSLSYSSFFDSVDELNEDMMDFNSPSLLFDHQFFDPSAFDIGTVGRFRLNLRFNLNIPASVTTLTYQDIVTILDGLIHLSSTTDLGDDIDHLQNRRVRAIGELLQIQFRSGFTRLERILSECMTICDPNVLRVKTLVNPKPILSMMREFFGSSQLSQFLDQINPLSELTHKRRISGLGPGGFSRDHVSFTVRDIHPSHYGRICPIETPEGQNAGLIASLASYARVNSFGFY